MIDASVVALDRTVHESLVLHADLHLPEETPRGTLLVAHGFMGYKDYGMMPRFAETATNAGWAGLRFNFAHSGMSRSIESFEYVDRFEQSTWNRQIEDLENLVEGVRDGTLHPSLPRSGPIVVLGHSRGGASAMLAAGRGLDVQGVVSIAAPADALRFSPEEVDRVRARGFFEVRSNRTKQNLRIDRAFIDEIFRDPRRHNVETMASNITCPLLVLHGNADSTIPLSDMHRIAEAAPLATTVELEGGTHVLNVVNPLAPGESSPQLDHAVASVVEFLAAQTQTRS